MKICLCLYFFKISQIKETAVLENPFLHSKKSVPKKRCVIFPFAICYWSWKFMAVQIMWRVGRLLPAVMSMLTEILIGLSTSLMINSLTSDWNVPNNKYFSTVTFPYPSYDPCLQWEDIQNRCVIKPTSIKNEMNVLQAGWILLLKLIENYKCTL